MQETWVRFLGWEEPLEKEMATHSSILAWRMPWMEEPGGLQSTGLQGVGHDWVPSRSLSLLTCIYQAYFLVQKAEDLIFNITFFASAILSEVITSKKIILLFDLCLYKFYLMGVYFYFYYHPSSVYNPKNENLFLVNKVY